MSVIFVPLLIAFVFTGIVWGIFKLVFKKNEIVAIVTSSIVILCLSYSRILGSIQDVVNQKQYKGLIEFGVGVLLIGLVALIMYLCLKFKSKLATPNKLLTLISLVLIVFTLFPIISFEAKAKKSFFPQEKKATEKKTPINQSDPDIYYIIFDRYAGPKATTEQYSFDNSEIYNFLTDRGFYVASESASNYPKTFLSFASSLNMEYVDYLTKQTNGGASSDETIVTPLIRNNKIMKFLKDRGYTYVQVGSWWQPTATNPNADILFVSPKGGYPLVDEFTTGYLNQTIASSLFEKLFHDPIDVSTDPWNNNHRQKMFYGFGIFPEVIKVPGPKFVFAHILAPHDPFVVNKDCEPIPETEVRTHDHVYNYLEQMQCVNTNMEKIVDQIQKGSKTPPIIIVQSDEGPFPMKKQIDSKQSWSKATDEQLAEKFPIMNAYYLPNSSASADLYPSISPVNSFKVVFNNYFGTNYDLLPDKHYIFKDENHYYQFVDVTDRLK